MRFPIFLLITMLVQLTSCHNGPNFSKPSKDDPEIEKLFKDYFGSELNQTEKMSLLASNYKKDYNISIDRAFWMAKEQLQQKSWKTKVEVLTRRYQIQKKNLPKEKLLYFKDSYPLLEEPTMPIVNLQEGVQLMNLGIGIVYGSFKTMFGEQSCQFVKEKDGWKINPNNETPKIDPEKEELKAELIEQHGDENAAIEWLLKQTLGGEINWEPITPR